MAKILVVDDDADMRNLVYTALTRDGHQVRPGRKQHTAFSCLLPPV